MRKYWMLLAACLCFVLSAVTFWVGKPPNTQETAYESQEAHEMEKEKPMDQEAVSESDTKKPDTDTSEQITEMEKETQKEKVPETDSGEREKTVASPVATGDEAPVLFLCFLLTASIICVGIIRKKGILYGSEQIERKQVVFSKRTAGTDEKDR